MKNKIVLFLSLICLVQIMTSCFIPAGVAVVSDGGCGVSLRVLYDDDAEGCFYDHNLRLYATLRNDKITEGILSEDEADIAGLIALNLSHDFLLKNGFDEDSFTKQIHENSSDFYIVVNDPESEHYLSDYETVKIKCDSSLYPDDDGDPLTITLKAKKK